MSKAYIGVGGNLGDVVVTINEAMATLEQYSGIKSVKLSSFYQSVPLATSSIKSDNDTQPLYINAVAVVDTQLSPEQLLTALQTIELQFGRIRTEEQWASRTLDLDIVMFDDVQINEPDLTIPHSGMLSRDFVLEPLFELAPDLHIPCYGALSSAVTACENRGLVKLKMDKTL